MPPSQLYAPSYQLMADLAIFCNMPLVVRKINEDLYKDIFARHIDELRNLLNLISNEYLEGADFRDKEQCDRLMSAIQILVRRL